MTHLANWLYPPQHDRIARNAIGLVLAGALVLAWGLLRFVDKIGA